MENDEFYLQLGRQWQQAAVSDLPEFSPSDARRAQRSQRRLHSLHRVLGLLSLMVAVYFLTLPVSAVTLVAALALIVTVGVDAWFVRSQQHFLKHWADWSPDGLMVYREKLLLTQLRAARYYILSSMGLLAFTAFLWVYAWLTPEFQSTGFHWLFSAFSLPVSGIILAYFSATQGRKKERLLRVQKLLADYADLNSPQND